MISRRSFLGSIAGGAVAMALPRDFFLQKKGTARPNVILCMTDDLGWAGPGFNGNSIIKTGNLDAMAEGGFRFRRFYSGAPVCSSTHGSCLTGRHPYRYGIFFANVGDMHKEEITLAEALKTQGYVTGHFGRWHRQEAFQNAFTCRREESYRFLPNVASQFSGLLLKKQSREQN